jgi:glutathione S-transferase
MPLTLVIGNKNYSSWSLRPWLFLRHFGIDFTELRIPLDLPETSDRIREHHAAAKVPVLKHGPVVIWDSLAILEYVQEAFGLSGLPEELRVRGVCRAVCAEMHSGFAELRRSMPMNCRRQIPGFVVPALAQADVQRVTQVWEECRERFGGRGPWLFGEFSMADAMYAPVVSRFRTYGVSLGPTCEAYVSTLLGHPAFCEWQQAAEQEVEVLDAEEV